VLLVPEEGDLGELSKVMIAWDGSRVAARAVADAIPFLVQAKQVVIAEVADEKLLPDQQASERLLKYLNERDVNASTVTLDLAGRSISECLQSEALALHIELLVMGGFGHSRVRDFILGGATKGLIADIQIPTLMSH
jgi:nucleotide-binding universal stress UspA family protein